MFLGLKTYLLYQSKGKKDISKSLKQLTLKENIVFMNDKMDVFDEGAIIIFISAEDDSIG